jgi:hypothetical protein
VETEHSNRGAFANVLKEVWFVDTIRSARFPTFGVAASMESSPKLETSNGVARKIQAGHCHLGTRAEVFDAELHAAQEALDMLQNLDTPAATAYLCVDNQSALDTLHGNASNTQYSRAAAHPDMSAWTLILDCPTRWNSISDGKLRCCSNESLCFREAATPGRAYGSGSGVNQA